jgi:NlpC/P60 family
MTAPRTGLAALALLLAGCAGAGRTRRPSLPPPAQEIRAGAPQRSAGPGPGERERAVEAAASLVGRRTIVLGGVDYGSDCAALVRAAFDRAGRPLPGDARDAAALYALAARRGALARQPAPGDLVFLADRPGGAPAHVALVSRLEPDGTALLLHRVARGVLRLRVNLAWPGRTTDPATGRHVNDTLVVGAREVPAGSLVVGVADLLRAG